jgi:hypothetical protein
MEITISKNDFEAALPVGVSAHDEVYESVEHAFGDEISIVKDSLLGEGGMRKLEADGETSTLMNFLRKYICVSAFLSVLRQLDLVLTPTGFGVVSNDNVAPASKQRVDALEAQLYTQRIKLKANVLNLLRSEEWGATEQAKKAIPCLYDAYTFFFETHEHAAYADWSAYGATIEGADELLRETMSDAQMDDILDAFRRADTGRMDGYRQLVSLITRFTDTYNVKGNDVVSTPVGRRIMRLLDDDANKETFALYRASEEYKAYHDEPFKNDKEASCYVFNG